MRDHLRCAILATDVMIPPLLNIVADYAHTGMWFTVSINSRRGIRTHVATTNSPHVNEYKTGHHKTSSNPSDWIARLDLLAQELSCSEAVFIPPYWDGVHTTTDRVSFTFEKLVLQKTKVWATRCIVREPIPIEYARYRVTDPSGLDLHGYWQAGILLSEIIAFQCASSYTLSPRIEMKNFNWRPQWPYKMLELPMQSKKRKRNHV